MLEFKMDLAGRELRIETGRLAKQANGAVLVQYGDTSVLATATMSKPREGIDFFPLLVDYEERMYSVGKIPGGFLRREGRPSEKATLSMRLIDRTLRPIFPDGFRNDIQIVTTVLAVDQNCAPEIAAMIGASAALSISDIPFDGPIAGVIVGLVDGELIINPDQEQSTKSILNLVVSGTAEAILMVEAGANEVSEEKVIEAILFGHEEIKRIIHMIKNMQQEIGRPKVEYAAPRAPEEMVKKVHAFARDKFVAVGENPDKHARETAVSAVMNEAKEHFTQEFPESGKQIGEILYDLHKSIVREMILERGVRPDGRDSRTIRPITCDAGVLRRTHGSALFTRGQTQVMSIATLGAMGDAQIIDDLGLDDSKRYLHHYNFPAFSVGETRPQRGPSRRDIGHGALAERALLPMIPSEVDFPYAIRVVSEVLESNGSTSQGAVCGSTLALMDAGVPLKSPVSGIAMGLIKEGDKYAILSDIQGLEDFLGDMDFKVAGTANGITALQMDMKVAGLDSRVLQEALAQAKEGRAFILGKMLEEIAEPRPELSPFAPRMFTLMVPVDRIKDVIGPGGRIINKIIAETGVKIDIEDDGRVFIAAVDAVMGERAVKMIEDLLKEVKAGEVFTGRVTRVEKYGAFVEVLPGKEALVHISQLAIARIAQTEDVAKVGDMLEIKVTEIDRMGRISGSRKELLLDREKEARRE
ncbi:MAG TPA: polyribonucleotide nucleotidyltransferase [Bacillota bacterium]|nr:polyribonucleotide nucleotidyltransferase [Bacillota bacterium]